MFSEVFLAMTPWEMEHDLPARVAYMACHFSPYGKGLSNLPTYLPENSILLLDDSMPMENHDPDLIALQLQEITAQFSVKAVLADFQMPINDAIFPVISTLLNALPCPVAVTKDYAEKLRCPVFLAPPPVNMPLRDYLTPWQNRDIFLEIAPAALKIILSETGSTFQIPPQGETYNLPLLDDRLHCHYQVTLSRDHAVFTLQRAKEDLAALAREACSIGVHSVIGLYQELYSLADIPV